MPVINKESIIHGIWLQLGKIKKKKHFLKKGTGGEKHIMSRYVMGLIYKISSVSTLNKFSCGLHNLQ